MTVMIKVIAITLILATVQSLEQLRENGLILNKIIELLSSNPMLSRRTVNRESLNKAKVLYNQITKNMNKKQIKHMLREGNGNGAEEDMPVDPEDVLAEEELKSAMSHKQSALLDRPHVEKEGKHDFLVLGQNVYDHFVTVVPNAIYHSVEKKCVNWLDDCSLKGIRARLLRGVQSPYR